jgi:X-Pro dipeptidyl-peptidase-like protein
MTTVNRATVRIPTPSGFDIEAWFYQPVGKGPFPAVVMGHGLGAVKVGGLASFAERFCREGFAAVVIDYRQWGGSDGQQPRDELNVPRQREDYSTAIGWAAAQPDIDEHRIFVWGTSFAGMHATALATSDHRLAGAIAQCPLVDGLAGSRLVRPSRSLKLFATAILDRIGSLVGRAPINLPVNVAPGEWGIADTSDALFGKQVMKPREPVDWHNRMAARSLLSIPAHRPVRQAGPQHPDPAHRRRTRHPGTGRSRTRPRNCPPGHHPGPLTSPASAPLITDLSRPSAAATRPHR